MKILKILVVIIIDELVFAFLLSKVTRTCFKHPKSVDPSSSKVTVTQITMFESPFDSSYFHTNDAIKCHQQ